MILFVSSGIDRRCLALAIAAAQANSQMHIVDVQPTPISMEAAFAELAQCIRRIRVSDFLGDVVPLSTLDFRPSTPFAVQTSVPPMPLIRRPQEAGTYG